AARGPSGREGSAVAIPALSACVKPSRRPAGGGGLSSPSRPGAGGGGAAEGDLLVFGFRRGSARENGPWPAPGSTAPIRQQRHRVGSSPHSLTFPVGPGFVGPCALAR